MRVLVCGSRDYLDPHKLIGALLTGLDDYTPQVDEGSGVTVIEGRAPGADRYAARAAERWQLGHAKFPSKWNEHHPDWCPGEWCRTSGKNYCVGAGPRRNQQMLDEGKPDIVVAFVAKPLEDSRGTHDMVTRAREAGIPTYTIRRM